MKVIFSWQGSTSSITHTPVRGRWSLWETDWKPQRAFVLSGERVKRHFSVFQKLQHLCLTWAVLIARRQQPSTFLQQNTHNLITLTHYSYCTLNTTPVTLVHSTLKVLWFLFVLPLAWSLSSFAAFYGNSLLKTALEPNLLWKRNTNKFEIQGLDRIM